MKALQATYNGQKYRSRTEAKWALFYRTVGIEYDYELEALDLDGLTYVPDFFLHPFRAWNEIKGEIINDQAGLLMLEKCTRLARQSNRPVILNFRDPLKPICAVFSKGRMYAQSHWTHCGICGLLALGVKDGTFSYVWCPRKHEAAPLDTKALLLARRYLFDAAKAAHQHRFGIPKREVLL